MLSKKIGSLSLGITSKCHIRSMATSTSKGIQDTNDVIADEIGDKGVITLNRPQAGNAITSGMIKKISTSVENWQNSKSMILIKSSKANAFCVGGDIQIDSFEEGKDFFKTEYRLDYIIGNLKIPYVALMNGNTCGTGAGLYVHGKFRIVTEKSIFAMPETTIGMIPDAGASYFLPRLPNRLIYYLGLTGVNLTGLDILHAGIATHYCESSKLPEIEKALLAANTAEQVAEIINRLSPKKKLEFTLSKHAGKIERIFNAPSVEDILKKLEDDDSQWAKETIQTLRRNSPLMLKLALRELNLGSKFSLGECLQMEFRLASHCVQGSNFSEGVRAIHLSQDKIPKWNPSRIEDVTEDEVLTYFKPLPDYDALDM